MVAATYIYVSPHQALGAALSHHRPVGLVTLTPLPLLWQLRRSS